MLSTFFIMLSGAVLCFILLLVLLSLHRTGAAGVEAWCIANGLGIVAFTLYAFGRQLPPILSYEVANGARFIRPRKVAGTGWWKQREFNR